jgi:hypothetical protein
VEKFESKQIFYAFLIIQLKVPSTAQRQLTASKSAMSSSSSSLSMPVMPTNSEPGSLLTQNIQNDNPIFPTSLSGAGSPSSFPCGESETQDQKEYYYELLATSSSIYDTDIDNISDLDPNNPVALQDFLARIGHSESSLLSSIPSSLLSSIGSEANEYDADDEVSDVDMAKLDIEMTDYAEGLSAISEEEEDESEDVEMSQLEFIRYMTSHRSLDPELDYEASHPSLARRTALPGNSNTSSDSNFSILSSRWTLHHHSPDEPSSTEPRSLTSSQDLSPIRGSVEYHEYFAGPSHYPEAAQFFAIDYSTGEFSNPFTTPPSSSRLQGSEEPSPRRRVNDYGLIEDWNFEIGNEEQASPVFSLSNYSQFVDDDVPVFPLLERAVVNERRNGIGSWLMRFDPVFNRSSSSSPSSASSSSSSQLFSATELVTQLNDVVFDATAHSFFRHLDVEALVADQASSAYTFEDQDILHDSWELENESPYRHWLPHEPRRNCHCWWCIEYWMPEEDEEYRPHDFDRRCSCPVCQSFRCQEMVREQKARDKELEGLRERKRKRQQSDAQNQSKALQDEKEASKVHVLRCEIRNVKEAQDDEEAEAAKESSRAFREEERRFADLRRFQKQDIDQQNAQESERTKGKKHCLGLFDWIKRQLREPESD